MPTPKMSQLTMFNHAHVYSMLPEVSLRLVPSHDQDRDRIGQHQDLLEAYLHAQNSILPKLSQCDELSAENVLNWIKETHQRIGKSLLASGGYRSGEYTHGMVIQWQLGSDFAEFWVNYYSGRLNRQDINNYALEKNVSVHSLTQFLSILQEFGRNNMHPINPGLLQSLKSDELTCPPLVAIFRLATAWNEQLLTAENRAFIKQFVTFPPYPHQIHEKMQEHAVITAAAYNNLDKTNLDEVCLFLAGFYCREMSIHPFINANTRTTLCMMNIFLKSMGYPDIILRKPCDQDNRKSAFNLATEAMTEDLAPLADYIKGCILEAQSSPFEDISLKELIVVRMALLETLEQIWQFDTGYSINKIEQIAQERHPADLLFAMRMANHDNNKGTTAYCTVLLNTASNILTNLQEQAAKKQDTSYDDSWFQPKKPLSANDIKMLEGYLSNIVPSISWKLINKPPTAKCWAQYPDSEMEQAQKDMAQLVSLSIFKSVKVSKLKGKPTPVIVCEQPDLEKMCALKLEAEDHPDTVHQLKK